MVVDTTKTWDTKNRIVDMVGQKKMTLTEISKELELAPSTVNQHIKELLAAGAIRQVDNPFVVKWKYYEANPSFPGFGRKLEYPRIQFSYPTNPIFKVIPVVLALAVIAAFAFLLGGQSNAQLGIIAGAVPAGATVFSISDAPAVSSISAVNMTVDSAQIHSTTTGKWYTILNTPKSYDLVKLNNISQLVGAASLPSGNYDEVLLEVQNVTAVVNNQTTNVVLPSDSLKIFGRFNISNSSNSVSWINLDINLDKSIHIAGNGKVIMLPVVVLRANSNANLSVEDNGTLKVISAGRFHEEFNEGMDTSGNMQFGQIPISTAAKVNITSGNGVALVSAAPANSTIVIRTPHKIIIIVDVNSSTAFNITGNTNNSTSVRVISIASGGAGAQLGTSAGTVQGTLTCAEDECRSSLDLNVNPTIPVRLRCLMVCPFAGTGVQCGCLSSNTIVTSNSTGGTRISLPCSTCPGIVTNSSGTYVCGPAPGSEQEWPSYMCSANSEIGADIVGNVSANSNGSNSSIWGMMHMHSEIG